MIQKTKRAAFALFLAVPAFLICSPEARAAGPSVVAFLKTYFAGGSANQVWTNNGDGTAKWATASAGGGSLQADYAAGGATGGTILATSTAKTFNLTAGPGSSAGGGSTFAAKVDYTTGTGPEYATAADLNGDGKLDIVACNDAATISVLLGNGDGTFAAKVDYAVPSGPLAIAIGDVNGDGKLDIIVGTTTHNVSVLLGVGDGTFAGHVDYATATGAVNGVVLGDFNGDGVLDIAAACGSSANASVLLGVGDGTFLAHVDYATGTGPTWIVCGDVNNDGKLDLVASAFNTSKASVLLGNGDGTFGAKTDFTVGAGPESVALGDLNGDGKLDIVTANISGNSVSVLLGNGDGTFGAKTDTTTGNGPYSVTIADVDGDGRLDVITANNTDGKVSVMLGNGTGALGAKTDTATNTAPTGVFAADLNGDGKADLVVACQSAAKVSVLLGTGGATPGGGHALQLGAGASAGFEGKFTVKSSLGVPLVATDGLSGVTSLSAMGVPGKYNGVPVVAMGFPTIVTQGRFAALTAAKSSVCSYKTGRFDASYEVVMNVLVTTATTHTFTCQCTYTDEGNTARTVTLPFRLVGDTTALTSSIVNTNGAVPYNGVPLRIRCKAATTITLLTQAAGTYTTVTFNVEGDIRRVS